MKIAAWLASLAVAWTFGTAAAQPAAERPLRLVLNVGLQNLDPIAGPSFVTRNFAYMVWDTLVAMDGKGEYRPQMLESWRASEDRLTWTFKLRPGVSFCDGKPFTARDVAYTITRWVDPATRSPVRWRAGPVKEVRAVDDLTVEYELTEPYGELLYQLTLFFAAIVD